MGKVTAVSPYLDTGLRQGVADQLADLRSQFRAGDKYVWDSDCRKRVHVGDKGRGELLRGLVEQFRPVAADQVLVWLAVGLGERSGGWGKQVSPEALLYIGPDIRELRATNAGFHGLQELGNGLQIRRCVQVDNASAGIAGGINAGQTTRHGMSNHDRSVHARFGHGLVDQVHDMTGGVRKLSG
jgi:hypothetical protein